MCELVDYTVRHTPYSVCAGHTAVSKRVVSWLYLVEVSLDQQLEERRESSHTMLYIANVI